MPKHSTCDLNHREIRVSSFAMCLLDLVLGCTNVCHSGSDHPRCTVYPNSQLRGFILVVKSTVELILAAPSSAAAFPSAFASAFAGCPVYSSKRRQLLNLSKT